MARPDPMNRSVPEGYHLEAAQEGPLFQVDRSGMYDCRHNSGRRGPLTGPRCTERTATIKINRRFIDRPLWWRYCEAHAYGRWIEGDQVMCWVAVLDVPA